MRLNDLLSRFSKVKQLNSTSYQVCCPTHEDSDPSLTVTEGEDRFLLHCKAGCEVGSVVSALGLEMKDLFKDSGDGVEYKKQPLNDSIKAIYPYYNEDGDVVYEKVRFKGSGKGTFRHTNEEGKVIWGITKGTYHETFAGSGEYARKKDKNKNNTTLEVTKDIERVLYNIPELVRAKKEGETLYIAEGEKDVETLRNWGLVGTTNFDGGGKGKFKKRYAKYFLDSDVVVIPDCDKAGREHQETIIENLFDYVKSIRVVELPNLESKKGFDLTDYVETGHTKEDFLKLVEQAEKTDKKSATLGSDTDTESNNDTEDNYTTKLGVIEGSEGYIYRTIGRDGDVVDKPISNFKINMLEVIELEEDTLLKAEVKGSKGTKVIEFSEKAFNNVTKFKETFCKYEFSFKGKDDYVEDIRLLTLEQDYERLKGVRAGGFHQIDGEYVYVSEHGAYDSELNEIKDVVLAKDSVILRSDLLEHDEITKEELEEVAPLLFKFNSLGNTSSMLGTIFTFFTKEKAFREGIMTKHLMIHGEAGAGKSDTRRYVLAPLLGLDDTFINCNNLSQFALNKFFGSSNSTPVVLEEYKPWKMKQMNIDAISDVLRNTYDMASGFRGNQNQGLNRYPLIAPAIIIGEEGQEETAIKERSMIVNFSKLESRVPERSAAFKELRSKQALLRKLGRGILNVAISKDSKAIAKEKKALVEKGIVSITDDRVAETAINAILGIGLLIELFKSKGLDFEKAIGIKMKDIIGAINDNCFNEILDGSSSSKTVLDHTLEMIDRMAGQGILIYDVNYTRVNNNSELALCVPSFYDSVTRYKHTHNVQGELITVQNQFTKQLRKASYFKEYKAVTFDGKRKRCFVLDVEKLKARDLEIDNLVK